MTEGIDLLRAKIDNFAKSVFDDVENYQVELALFLKELGLTLENYLENSERAQMIIEKLNDFKDWNSIYKYWRDTLKRQTFFTTEANSGIAVTRTTKS